MEETAQLDCFIPILYFTETFSMYQLTNVDIVLATFLIFVMRYMVRETQWRKGMCWLTVQNSLLLWGRHSCRNTRYLIAPLPPVKREALVLSLFVLFLFLPVHDIVPFRMRVPLSFKLL